MKSEWCTIDQFDKAEKVAPRRMRLAFQLLSLLLVDLHFLLSHARRPKHKFRCPRDARFHSNVFAAK